METQVTGRTGGISAADDPHRGFVIFFGGN